MSYSYIFEVYYCLEILLFMMIILFLFNMYYHMVKISMVET